MRTEAIIIFATWGISAACSDDETSDNVGGDATNEVRPDGSTPPTDSGTTTMADGDTSPPDSDATTPDARDTTTATSPETADTNDVDTGPVQICIPGEYVCSSTRSRHLCNGDGTGFLDDEQCPTDQTCTSGLCVAKCPNDPKFGSYVGCEFWATDLPNYPDPTLNPTPENSPWAIVISNPGRNPVTVSFEMPPLFTYAPTDPSVPAGESRVFELPNINVQGTSLRPKGVHITATGPVTAHQFNPYDVRFSNDASLLLPDPLLGDQYAILAWVTAPLELSPFPANSQNGYFTVIAAFDDTSVTIQPSAHVKASGPIPELQAGQLFTIKLNRGDVLSVQSDPKTLFEESDITGSRVTADKPISVFGGHEEAVIGDPIPDGEGGTRGPCCADHLEEQMLPVGVAGTTYFAIKSPPRGTVEIEDDWWRIQALEPNVVITTSPPQPDGNNVTLSSIGDYVTLKSKQSFSVTGTGKIQIGQYLTARDTTEDFNGDSSLVLMVATDRFRKDYVFLAPDYKTTGLFGQAPVLWATVVKKVDAVVTFDGVAIDDSTFAALGSSGYEYGYVSLNPGVYEASSTEKFGLYVYGYNNAVSFSYIGGLAISGE